MRTVPIFIFILTLCFSAYSAESYSAVYDGKTGKVVGIQRSTDGALIPISLDNRDYVEFVKWNTSEIAAGRGVSLADRAPDPIPAAEIERRRRLAVALTYLKAIPDAWENGTNDQKLMWAIKQALKEIRDNTD
jgi:hypothetical protein